MVMREESDSFGMGAPGGMLNSVAKFSRSAPRPMSVKPSIVSSESSHPAGTIYPEVKKKDFTKISSELTALVNKMNAGKLTDSEQVVQMRIEFTAYSKELKAFIKQNAARVVFLSEKGGKVIVKIHLNHLKKLAQFKEITVIKLEK
jgi:hypothetical protein